MKTEIGITYRREDFEEIFFKDRAGDYFRSESVRGSFSAMAILGITLFMTLIYATFYSVYPLIVWLLALMFVTHLVNYVRAARKLYRWKKEVKDYLDSTERYRQYSIILSAESFTIRRDDEDVIEKWENFKSAYLSDAYIRLYGQENFFIPSKSMSSDEYQVLREAISEKIK
jgi:hypothetical protein